MTTNLNEKKNKLAAGWIIVIACTLMQAIPGCVISNTPPLFIHPVTTERGFTLAAFSLTFSIGTIVSAVAGPFIGSLFNKINVKVLYLIGAIIAGSAFFSFGFAQELWHFYVISGMAQIGAAIISGIGIPLLINAWFDEKSKGKALGIAFAGGSIGNFFLQPIGANIIANHGYARAYMVFGILSLIIGIPIALFLIKMPKNASEIVTSNKSEDNDNKDNSSLNLGYTLKEATKTKYFWFAAIGFSFMGLYVSAYSIQYAAYFQGALQFDASVIGITGSVFAFASLLGNLLGGSLFDKLGSVKCLILSGVLVLVSGTCILLAKNNVLFVHLFSAIRGFAVYAYMIGPAYLVGSYFGNKEYGSILGIIQLFFAIGISSGSVIFGLIVQNFGYDMAWTIMIGVVAVTFALLITSAIGMNKLNKKNNQQSKAA
ncbi:MAG: conjugated bile salt MFS transporter [Peptostreptococcaceae bacterium]